MKDSQRKAMFARSKILRDEGKFHLYGDFPQFTNKELDRHTKILTAISSNQKSEIRERELALDALKKVQDEKNNRLAHGIRVKRIQTIGI